MRRDYLIFIIEERLLNFWMNINTIYDMQINSLHYFTIIFKSDLYV